MYPDSFRIVKSMQLDIASYAGSLDGLYGEFLIQPEAGLYSPKDFRIKLVPGNEYYVDHLEDTRIADASGFIGEVEKYRKYQANGKTKKIDIIIYDKNSEMVCTGAEYAKLLPAPEIPVSATSLIMSYVSNIIERNTANAKGVKSSFELIEEYLTDTTLMRGDVYLAEAIECNIRDLYDIVRGFIGDNKWIMHFLSNEGTLLRIDKGIDFRIYDWERRTKSGEWK